MPSVWRLWLIAAIPLLLTLGALPVQRTQEARVVETARQMIGHGPDAWLIPRLNGVIRLRKPPMAYWMAAASFKLFGVSEFSARLPTGIVSWLTLAATYSIASRLFGKSTGLLSAGFLLASYLFFRFGSLAETDAPATLFATVAVDFFWRAADAPSFLLFHAAAAATGLSLFAKQGPGFFPILFFLTLTLARRQPKTLLRFILSGAPLTLLILAGWWYGYAIYDRGFAQFHSELAEVTEGIDHGAWFYVYFPMLLLDTAPWTLLAIGALVAAIKRFKTDPKLAGLLIWAAADFVPLCFLGNVQEHYLLPLMPPLMILAAWLVSQAATSENDPKLAHAAQSLIAITIIASIVAPLFVPVVGYSVRGHVMTLDVALAVGISLFCALSWRTLKNGMPATAATQLIIPWTMAIAMLLSVWGLTVAPSDIRTTAAAIQQDVGNGPFVFYGGDTSLPLCFALRQAIPRIDDSRPDLLTRAAAQSPKLAVIWQIPQHGSGPNLPPAPFMQVGPDFGAKGQAFRIFQLPPHVAQ